MRIVRILLPLLLTAALGLSAQVDPIWEDLSDVRFTTKYNFDMGYDVEYPIFGAKAKAMHRQEVVIKGYMIALDGAKETKHFMLSAYPFQACFFCGKAGPESVMEIFSRKEIEFEDKVITLKGKLFLNYDDINQMIYILQDAELID